MIFELPQHGVLSLDEVAYISNIDITSSQYKVTIILKSSASLECSFDSLENALSIRNKIVLAYMKWLRHTNHKSTFNSRRIYVEVDGSVIDLSTIKSISPVRFNEGFYRAEYKIIYRDGNSADVMYFESPKTSKMSQADLEYTASQSRGKILDALLDLYES